MEQTDKAQNRFFDSVIKEAELFLKKFGFKRSGKSFSFYNISADKTKGCLIVFRKSIYNTSYMTRFSINYVCAASAESNITLGSLKQSPELDGISFDVFSLDGSVCDNESSGEYFSKAIKPKLQRIINEFERFGFH